MNMIVHGIVDGHFHGAVVRNVLAHQNLSHFGGLHVQLDGGCAWILKAVNSAKKKQVVMMMEAEESSRRWGSPSCDSKCTFEKTCKVASAGAAH